MVVTLLTSHDEISPLKEEAPRNACTMLVTLLTSQSDRSSLKVLYVLQYVDENKCDMFVTRLVPQVEMFP